jgi:hypothetical protein
MVPAVFTTPFDPGAPGRRIHRYTPSAAVVRRLGWPGVAGTASEWSHPTRPAGGACGSAQDPAHAIKAARSVGAPIKPVTEDALGLLATVALIPQPSPSHNSPESLERLFERTSENSRYAKFALAAQERRILRWRASPPQRPSAVPPSLSASHRAGHGGLFPSPGLGDPLPLARSSALNSSTELRAR